jgi:hypothetical protein
MDRPRGDEKDVGDRPGLKLEEREKSIEFPRSSCRTPDKGLADSGSPVIGFLVVEPVL